MLKNVSHFVDSQNDSEILYDTPFGYMFEYLCGCSHHLLATGPTTIHYLQELGKVMADMGTQADPNQNRDSTIPAVYTYLGQFIDHDITARTDRESNFSEIGSGNIDPLDPEAVRENLRNGRRPQLDLDSVFGEGPRLNSKYRAQADKLFNNTSLNLHIEDQPATFLDLRRETEGTGEEKKETAIIADARNDENLLVGQLHASFIKLYNKINTDLEENLSNQEAYARARQLTRWAYQYIVINDYLNQVCDSSVVADVVRNGPYFYNNSIPFMPLEFSVAGFRFGHSMIRPFYKLNNSTTKNIMDLLEPGKKLIDPVTKKIRADHVVEWSNFAAFNGNNPTNFARIIDPFIAKGLFNLSPLGTPMPPQVLASLTQRNLLRGYLLSIPTGQAIAEAMRIEPMRHEELVDGLNAEQKCVMYDSGFTARTPLWYYVLQEAKVQNDGNSLGYVGSKLVAETLVGLIKYDVNSYLNNMHDPNVSAEGITLPNRATPVKTMADLLDHAGVPIG